MKRSKFVLLFAMVFLLTACNMKIENVEEIEPHTSHSGNIQYASVGDEDFKLTLQTEKVFYKVGEKIKVQAILENAQDEDIKLGHGGSWVWLETKNITKNYQFGAVMNEPYIITPIKAGESITTDYQFSGGTYTKDSPGEKYSDEEFSKMADLKFPVGQYEIYARTDFHIEGKEKQYSYEAKIVFEVIE